MCRLQSAASRLDPDIPVKPSAIVLFIAGLIQRNPKRTTAAITAFLMGAGTFAMAALTPAEPPKLVRLVTEPVQADVAAQGGGALTLYRNGSTRSSDTPEALLARMGVVDAEAARFLRGHVDARNALFSRTGRPVAVQADDGQKLLSLRTHWLDKPGSQEFRRLIVEKTEAGLTARVETAPLQVGQRVASGVIRSSLFAAADEVNLPDSVTYQLADIFGSAINFHKGLRKGDSFSVVYETLEADGEPVRAGRVLSAEFVNRGKAHEAVWFQESGNPGQGGYFDFAGESLRRAYLAAPLPVLRVTSKFGERHHPILGYTHKHTGVDYAAPTGTPVRTIGDGTVTVAGAQNGYGNVIYISHLNGKDSTVYAHLSRIDVKPGQKVSQGDVIGAVGATGRATGPHLHFEFRVENKPVNPTVALAEHSGAVLASVAKKETFAQLSLDMQAQLESAKQMAGAAFE